MPLQNNESSLERFFFKHMNAQRGLWFVEVEKWAVQQNTPLESSVE